MTREEAIVDIRDNIKPVVGGKSLDMAIKALEQERSRLAQITQYRNDCEKLMQENEQLKKALKQEPCEDAISRKAVLDMTTAIRTSDYSRIIEVVDIDDVKALPSVKPKEPYFWDKCPYYEPDIMFDGKDEYDMGKCTYKQEPCEDAISRQAVLDAFWKLDVELRPSAIDAILNIANELPSVKPQEPFDIETYCKEHFCVMVDKDVWEKAEKALKREPKTGKWRQIGYDIYECSICGQDVMTGDICAYRHCHCCGAKMIEPQERSNKE